VLLAIDEKSYDPGIGAMGNDHPIAWSRAVGTGRAWYTGLGHSSETYTKPSFQRHLLGGILWAAGRPAG
jgi:type 1 glutamine amidotransferase